MSRQVWVAFRATVKPRLGIVGHYTTRPREKGSRKLAISDRVVKTSLILLGVPELPDDLLRRELLFSWHLLPSLGLHHPEILSLTVATFKGRRSILAHIKSALSWAVG